MNGKPMTTWWVLAWTLVASAAFSQQAPGMDELDASALRADLFFLASDEMRGRLVASAENDLATAFIRSRFQRLGLRPAHGHSFYQPFEIINGTLGSDNEITLVNATGATSRAQMRQGFFPLAFSASGSVESEVVFSGFGISAPKLSHDDFRDGAVRGKIALVLDHEPGENEPESVFDGLVTSEYSRNLRKALYAQRAGAIGILFVSDVHNHGAGASFQGLANRSWPEPGRRIPRYLLGDWAEQVRIPALQISPALADDILRASGRSLSELSPLAEVSGGAAPVVVSSLRVKLTADVRRNVVTSRNVIAAIDGADPELADEWVIVSAHMDHDGADGNRIWNGADDDGSGTVALLAIAAAYAAAAEEGIRPKRSVLFASWNAEEAGLLGAWAFAESPSMPRDRIVAVLNMDMIGRNEEVPKGGGRRFRGLSPQTAASNANAVNILGHSYSGDLTDAVREANRDSELTLKMGYDNNPSNLLRRSDQWPFLQKAVPSLFFHTGLHPDYHTEFDVPERIEYEKLERIARLVHQLSWDLANQSERPGFDKPAQAAAVP